ncbi:hypothetical protein [Lactiplantibacillus plantarum]|uniref:hypothetical protein n=1 Tax=Lactiplantibacillus plantarum TaxID=1590 RepID=UPI0020A33A4B|nr:hypothetical protein [Lactiplantibacillus plantarum]MCG0783251.1 minor capsid protein [Lactiplantibacillus plantarum]UTD39867.1 hypothetical protein H5V40_10115 [Lactiplantibacillus plantarum]
MTAINLAGGPQEFAEFKFGKRHAKLYFNDELNMKLADTRLSVGNHLHALDDQKRMAELDDKPVEEQRQFLNKLYKDLRGELSAFFDDQFGEGAGDDLYRLTNKSTERMAAAFFMVVKEYDELREQRDSYIDTYYKSRKATKKK